MEPRLRRARRVGCGFGGSGFGGFGGAGRRVLRQISLRADGRAGRGVGLRRGRGLVDGCGRWQQLPLSQGLACAPGQIAVATDQLLEFAPARVAGLVQPVCDGVGCGDLDDLPGLGIADVAVFEGAVQFRQLFEAAHQLQEIARAGLGETQLLVGVLVHAGKTEILEQPAALDLRKPEHGTVLGAMHPVDGGLEGTMGLRGRLSGAKGDGIHGQQPCIREEVFGRLENYSESLTKAQGKKWGEVPKAPRGGFFADGIFTKDLLLNKLGVIFQSPPASSPLHKYQLPSDRYGAQGAAIFSSWRGVALSASP